MKVLITGATGLIGTQLTKECHKAGISVNYLTTSKDKIEDKPNYKGFYWNPYEGEIDENAFTDVTTIINLVGATISKRWTKSYRETILESRTKTANLIYNTLEKTKTSVKHFISASGVSIYPNSESRLYTEEDTDVDTTFLAEVVQAWENAADQFKKLDMRVTKVRTGVVLAEEEGAFPKIVQPIEKGFGAPLGNGKQWMSWIHLEDIVCIYIHILKNGLQGVYNATAPNPVTNEKMTRKIAAYLKKDLWLPKVPGFVLRLVLGKMSILVLKGQLVSSKKLEESGYEFKYVNVAPAIKNLL
ncbi:TIGR01777 family oxidoreductase [Marixanthomonas ophiurae]|uniref:TIGR01777 family protein n=1 Tax=Marixanthomonas ophiurae TaxID=387659 RepID=A0A3E1QCW7_9FLAO|nr:TIGR01777 family oxidoreductase [Marixanthomonas ophiurae]RFN59995.1 TIGR01777 family protein [Marixanthomonas ophiurae]